MPLLYKVLEWLHAPGWRGHLLALIAGTLTTLSFTPFDLWPLGLLSIALLYQGLRHLNGRQALWRGWCWGLGLFLSGVSWIYISIHVHGYASPPLAGLLTGGLVAGLALIPALTAWRSEEHTSELQSRPHLVCRLLLEKKNRIRHTILSYASLLAFHLQ